MNWWCELPKLDLTTALQIKGASGEFLQLKGQGFSWEKPSSWSPVSLFSSGQAGGLYLPGSSGSMFKEDTLTTPAVVGDTLGGLIDFSGNGNHALQSDSTRRPTIVNNSGKVGLLFDSTNDVLNHPGAVLGQSPEFEVSLCYIPNDPTNWMLMNRYLAPSPWWVAAQKGSTSTAMYGGTGATFEAMYFNNSLWTGTTRGHLYSASQDASRLLFQGTSTSTLTEIGLFKYSSGSYTAPGIILGILIREGRMSETERQLLDTFWQSLL